MLFRSTEHNLNEELKDLKYFREGFQIAVNRVNALKSALLESIYAITASSPHHAGDSMIYTPQINTESVDSWRKCLQAPSESKSKDEWNNRTEREEGTTPLNAKQCPELLDEDCVF